MYEQLIYQIADIKALIYDISNSTRGVCGVKKPFNYKELPSYAKTKQSEQKCIQNETEEQRLQRHRRFFEQMKKAYGPKQMTEEQKEAFKKKCQQPIINDESKYDVEDEDFYN